MRANHAQTAGLVVAASGTCLQIQKDERDLVTGRAFKPAHPRDLAGLALPESWFLGVLLCPGDDTRDLASWARTLDGAGRERIHFYFVRGVNVHQALEAWTQAGLPDPPINEVASFSSFHHLYGRHHANRVFRDHSPA